MHSAISPSASISLIAAATAAAAAVDVTAVIVATAVAVAALCSDDCRFTFFALFAVRTVSSPLVAPTKKKEEEEEEEERRSCPHSSLLSPLGLRSAPLPSAAPPAPPWLIPNCLAERNCIIGVGSANRTTRGWAALEREGGDSVKSSVVRGR